MSTPAAPVTSPPRTVDQAPKRRRRRYRRWVLGVVALLLVLAVADAGAGWYFSNQVLDRDQPSYPVQVLAVEGGTVTLSRDSSTERPIPIGLSWNGGHAVLDGRVRVDGDRVVRNVVDVSSGSLTTGLRAGLDYGVYDGDPKSARSLDFTTVQVQGELGDLPAWFVPSPNGEMASDTWVVAVHGRGGSREEALRILPTFAELGLPTLVISYRNDTGAPASPDHWYHLGDSEWRDVDAAVAYAQANGAHQVILYGWSMGGGMVLTALRRMAAAQVSAVKAVVLDSPVVDWGATLQLQASHRHLPGALTWTAERIVEWRGGFKFDALDQLRYADNLNVPVLLFVDLADSTVPVEPALRLAEARPDLVKVVTTAGGDHTGSWNADPAAYQIAVREFLSAS
jgi:pimeloyl-ACP methyl ester carboxylesterase